MELTDDRNGLKITKKYTFLCDKGWQCDFVNRRTVANIRRTEYAVMDCPQWYLMRSRYLSDSKASVFAKHIYDALIVDNCWSSGPFYSCFCQRVFRESAMPPIDKCPWHIASEFCLFISIGVLFNSAKQL